MPSDDEQHAAGDGMAAPTSSPSSLTPPSPWSSSGPPAAPAARIGVFGGSFNPIHLGHVLLAITTQQTKRVDGVVLVPVYKHARKTDLLPFADRVEMCRLAVAPFAAASSASSAGGGGVEVSTIEEEVGESNGAMLKALKRRYPPNTELLWICGDDVFNWIEKPKGLETMAEVSGLIVQRRLHRGGRGDDDGDDGSTDPDRFYKEPLDESRIRSVAARLELGVDFIYGELPHFSSTLVRRAPGEWRSFLPRNVARFLDGRPDLLARLHDNLKKDASREERGDSSRERPAAADADVGAVGPPSTASAPSGDDRRSDAGGGGGDGGGGAPARARARALAAECVVRGLEAVHSLQFERGQTGLFLSVGSDRLERELAEARDATDAIVREIAEGGDGVRVGGSRGGGADSEDEVDLLLVGEGFDEAAALLSELRRIPSWLSRDRDVASRRAAHLRGLGGADGWVKRFSLVEKFNPRIDVLVQSIVRALREILEFENEKGAARARRQQQLRDAPDLLLKWSMGKEALGRLRAFVSAGGAEAPSVVRTSLRMRSLLNQFVETKERRIARVLSLKSPSGAAEGLGGSVQLAAPDALHRMLETIASWEWSLMGCPAPSTPLPLVHKLLLLAAGDKGKGGAATAKLSLRYSSVGAFFDVESFFAAMSAAIDLMLSEAKAIAAFGCAGAY